jgi:hypothetical protein
MNQESRKWDGIWKPGSHEETGIIRKARKQERD